MRKRKGAVILALAMMLLLVPVMAQAERGDRIISAGGGRKRMEAGLRMNGKVSTETGICLMRMDISVMDGTGMEQTGTIWAESLTEQ